MSTKVFHTCDKCEKTWEDGSKDANPVAIQLRLNFGAYTVGSWANHEMSAMWCGECIMRYGISKRYDEKDKAIVPAILPTLEEVLVTLLEDFFVRK